MPEHGAAGLARVVHRYPLVALALGPRALVDVQVNGHWNTTVANAWAVVAPVAQRVPGRWSEDDIMRVTLHILSHGDNCWLAIDDPIPSGATILDKGLGDESIAAQLADRDGGKKGSPTLGIFCMSTDFTHGRRVQDPGSLHASCRLKGTFYA